MSGSLLRIGCGTVDASTQGEVTMNKRDYIIAALACVAFVSFTQAFKMKGMIEGRAPACTHDLRKAEPLKA